jgi:putative addiction module component (TIGR02574 family)
MEIVIWGNMTAVAKKIEREIRQLALDDMLALHEHLVESIHEKESAQSLDPAFRDEIQRRVKEIDLGKPEGVDAFQALKEM